MILSKSDVKRGARRKPGGEIQCLKSSYETAAIVGPLRWTSVGGRIPQKWSHAYGRRSRVRLLTARLGNSLRSGGDRGDGCDARGRGRCNHHVDRKISHCREQVTRCGRGDRGRGLLGWPVLEWTVRRGDEGGGAGWEGGGALRGSCIS